MAYDEKLAARVRKLMGKGAVEKKMFGGVAFMLKGKMCLGVNKQDLMVRVGPERYEEALKMKGARPMDFTGRPIKGFVFVGQEGYEDEDALRKWVRLGSEYASIAAKGKRGST